MKVTILIRVAKCQTYNSHPVVRNKNTSARHYAYAGSRNIGTCKTWKLNSLASLYGVLECVKYVYPQLVYIQPSVVSLPGVTMIKR